jgi:hypothetical protein
MKIHDEIDNYLAADIHGELSDDERNALHTHLVECATCRGLHQENKTINKILEENLATDKPDGAFEQRMLAGFRNRIPQRTGSLVKLIVDLMRLRATQITAVVAVLLALVQVGRMITGEGATAPRHGDYSSEEQVAVGLKQTPLSSSKDVGDLDKSASRAKETDRLAAGKLSSFAAAQDVAVPAPAPAPEFMPEFHEETKMRAAKFRRNEQKIQRKPPRPLPLWQITN